MVFTNRLKKQASSLIGLLLAVTIAQADEQSLVDVSIGSNQIGFIMASADIAKVVVAGPSGFHKQSTSTQVPFNLPLKDGLYRYEIATYYLSNEVIVADGRNGRDNQSQSSPRRTKVTSGQFRINNGALVTMDETE